MPQLQAHKHHAMIQRPGTCDTGCSHYLQASQRAWTTGCRGTATTRRTGSETDQCRGLALEKLVKAGTPGNLGNGRVVQVRSGSDGLPGPSIEPVWGRRPPSYIWPKCPWSRAATSLSPRACQARVMWPSGDKKWPHYSGMGGSAPDKLRRVASLRDVDHTRECADSGHSSRRQRKNRYIPPLPLADVAIIPGSVRGLSS